MRLDASLIPLIEKHVPEEDLMADNASCPLCGDPTRKKRVLTIQQAPPVYLEKCSRCKAVSASRMPETSYLKSYYKDYYGLFEREQEKEQVTFEGSPRFARHIARYVNALPTGKEVSVLDFGGGDGALAFALVQALQKGREKAAFSVDVVDLSTEKLAPPEGIRARLYRSLEELDNEPQYDIVLASAIIEHLPAPGKDLASLLKNLKQGGYIYIRTPYVAPLKQLAGKVPFLFPMHLHDLGPSFWNRLPQLFRQYSLSVVVSQPAIVSTSFRKNPILTILAYLMKFPGFVEGRLRRPVDYFWNYTAGWEVIYHRD